MNRRIQQAVESLIAAKRSYLMLPYPTIAAAKQARETYDRAQDEFRAALSEEATGGREPA